MNLIKFNLIQLTSQVGGNLGWVDSLVRSFVSTYSVCISEKKINYSFLRFDGE